jgi:hypothetical protein
MISIQNLEFLTTLKQWKSHLQMGLRLHCSYRQYAPDTAEFIPIKKVQTNAVPYVYAGVPAAVGSFIEVLSYGWERACESGRLSKVFVLEC